MFYIYKFKNHFYNLFPCGNYLLWTSLKNFTKCPKVPQVEILIYQRTAWYLCENIGYTKRS